MAERGGNGEPLPVGEGMALANTRRLRSGQSTVKLLGVLTVYIFANICTSGNRRGLCLLAITYADGDANTEGQTRYKWAG